MIKPFTMYNGVTIPHPGFGTWKIPDGEIVANAVKTALQNGYTHIDTAKIYGNEVGVGQGIRDAGVKREDIFVTSKLWNEERGYDNTIKACEKSLKDLQMDYLDLYLIHWPANEKLFPGQSVAINCDTWRAMEDLYKAGKVRAIGLSNFWVPYLQIIMDNCTIKPMVNQIEFHPGFLQEDTRAMCADLDIVVEGWSPLGSGKMLENPTLKEIATHYNKSVAQLCVRWALQHHVLPMPKSATAERIVENRQVFDFEINAEDMQTIDALPYIGGSGFDPSTRDF